MKAGTPIKDWTTKGCPVCNGHHFEDVFELPSIPVYAGLLWPSADEARQAPRGRLLLALCTDCGYVGNRAFDESLIAYHPGYEISLHFSGVYEQFLERLVRRLTDSYDLTGKNVVEIGCGQGHFLKLLCSRAHCNGFGFDPCVKKEEVVSTGNNKVQLVRGFYSDKHKDIHPDFVCCRHVLQSIPDPAAFLTSLRRIIEDRPEVTVYFEMPNADYVFGNQTKWNYMYEYVTYFHGATLARLFSNCGFTPVLVQPCYEDNQYLSIDARTGRIASGSVDKQVSSLADFITRVRQYGINVSRRITEWNEKLDSLANQRILAWGAGGRAISFFNALDIHEKVPCVVDINPDRQKMFISGTGQEVVPPEFVSEYRPDVMIVTNPTYTEEIRRAVHELGVCPRFEVI